MAVGELCNKFVTALCGAAAFRATPPSCNKENHMATDTAISSPYRLHPTFEDLNSRLRREVLRLRIKAATGADAQALAGVQANLRALCDEFAAWRERHLEVI
jgi:hypothetical protein